jgi:hypothetical protein
MKTRRAAMRGAAEGGSAAVAFAIALPVMIGFIGLALDLSYIYVRKSELQKIADNVAITAARELNGTKAGVTAAKNKAYLVGKDSNYNFASPIYWDGSALSFAASADASDSEWKSVSSIGTDADAAGLSFAKVDTRSLTGVFGGNPGLVETVFIRVLPGAATVVNMHARAVAGPTSVQVMPLAVCALDANPSGTRSNPGSLEKLEFGFRRGVSYNLLDLSPNSSVPQNYLVNPVDPGSGTNHTSHFAEEFVKPFFCTGTLALPKVVAGSTVHVQALGPLNIHEWLNSRFNDYPGSAGCNVLTAPPDTNIREFTGGYANWYMENMLKPDGSAASYPASAASTVRKNPVARVSFADLTATDTTDDTPSTGSFGPLWTYSKAQKTDGAPYDLPDWANLYAYKGYSPVLDKTKYGNSNVPYLSPNHTSAAPSSTNPVQHRRVLNIPLLDCAAGSPSAPASVLGIGRFFMTARATSSPQRIVPGEFAGLLQAGGGPTTAVALYR